MELPKVSTRPLHRNLWARDVSASRWPTARVRRCIPVVWLMKYRGGQVVIYVRQREGSRLNKPGTRALYISQDTRANFPPRGRCTRGWHAIACAIKPEATDSADKGEQRAWQLALEPLPIPNWEARPDICSRGSELYLWPPIYHRALSVSCLLSSFGFEAFDTAVASKQASPIWFTSLCPKFRRRSNSSSPWATLNLLRGGVGGSLKVWWTRGGDRDECFSDADRIKLWGTGNISEP